MQKLNYSETWADTSGDSRQLDKIRRLADASSKEAEGLRASDCTRNLHGILCVEFVAILPRHLGWKLAST